MASAISQPMFRGIIPPMITPLEQKSVDLRSLARLTERIIEGGADGLFVLGTTGEGPSLLISQRQQVVAAVCDQAARRIPVLVGITDTVFENSVEIADMAYSGGAAAVVLAPPYYLPMSQTELIRYTLRLVDSIELPVMLYNMPSCCKTWFEPETVRRLSRVSSIVGLKDSSGDLDYFSQVASLAGDRPDFALFVGPEEILVDAMRRGCHGGVHGGANMFPRLYTDMYQAAEQGDWKTANQLQQTVLQLGESVYSLGDGPSRIIKGIKTVCEIHGVCSREIAEPFEAHSDEEKDEIQRRLDSLSLLPEHV